MLVIDNGSTDATAETVAGYRNRLPIRSVIEPTPGLSHARNRGVAEATGEYICWTDDDVIVEKQWLANYVAAFIGHPEAAIFGGKILPQLERPTPRWFAECAGCAPVKSVMVHRDIGDVPFPLSPEGDRLPWGANFALRRVEQLRIRYDSQLGHAPHHRRTGEETDVIFRLMAEGARGWWVPDCVVRHSIPPRRQRLGEVLRHFHAVGETAAYKHETSPGRSWLESPRSPRFLNLDAAALRRRRAKAAAGFLIAWLGGDRPLALRRLSRLGLYSGVASYRRARVTRKQRSNSVAAEPASLSRTAMRA